MFAGQIVERGPSEAIIRDPRHPYTRLLLSAVPDAGDPDRRATEGGGRAFTERAEKVRGFSRRPAGPAEAVAPHHFVRHRSAADREFRRNAFDV